MVEKKHNRRIYPLLCCFTRYNFIKKHRIMKKEVFEVLGIKQTRLTQINIPKILSKYPLLN